MLDCGLGCWIQQELGHDSVWFGVIKRGLVFLHISVLATTPVNNMWVGGD